MTVVGEQFVSLHHCRASVDFRKEVSHWIVAVPVEDMVEENRSQFAVEHLLDVVFVDGVGKGKQGGTTAYASQVEGREPSDADDDIAMEGRQPVGDYGAAFCVSFVAIVDCLSRFLFDVDDISGIDQYFHAFGG